MNYKMKLCITFYITCIFVLCSFNVIQCRKISNAFGIEYVNLENNP